MFRSMDLIGNLARPAFHNVLQGGQLEVWEGGYPLFVIGDGNGPNFIVNVNGPHVFQEILQNPDLHLGETYVDKKWDLVYGDLGQFLSWVTRNNTSWISGMPLPAARPNNPEASRKNVSYHYDLGNELYQSFLDEGLNYSCAFFNDHRMSLRDAQLNKIYTTIERSHIKPGMKILEIGCGWGELSRIISRSIPDVEVTGITLAENQISWACGKIRSDDENPPKFVLSDYRDHAREYANTYDRIISIGMFEHVGHEYHSEFFKAVYRLLKPGGTALIHSIMRAEPGCGTSAWLDNYIFPGGSIPYLPTTLEAAQKEGLRIVQDPFIHHGTNYAETLRRWRQNFHENSGYLRARNHDVRFKRLWNFYLAMSEASFDGYGNFVAQMIFQKEK